VPASVLSFPFRITPSGSAAVVEHGSDDEITELLAVAALTAPGERIQVPTFGVDDPTFVGFEVANLQRHCNDFGPDVTVTHAAAARRTDEREALTLSWERRGDSR
jgi:orotidine-5'-phosphate decarboxylase